MCLGCCFSGQLVDDVINYCGTSAPVYIFWFLIAIFRTVPPVLNEDCMCYIAILDKCMSLLNGALSMCYYTHARRRCRNCVTNSAVDC